MEPSSTAHTLALTAHLLLFAWWLGGDLGVFYSSGRVVDASQPRAARLMAGRIMLALDVVPRICMSLMLTVSALLTETVGIPHPAWQMTAVLLLGPVWLALVLFLHLREGSAAAPAVRQLDLALRWVVIAAVVASATWSLASGRLGDDPWLAAKLYLFAFLVFCGLMIRRGLPPFIAGYAALAAGRETPESDRAMAESLARMRPWVLAIWAGLVASAVLGVAKPGSALLS
jgi:heme/copper-type cytochrome/quinol oxidase subunit 4